ncbi:MAG: phospholipid-binding protein MlaC [Thiohalophilus sp.]
MNARKRGRRNRLAGLVWLMTASLCATSLAVARETDPPPADPQQLVIDTTERMLAALEEHGAQLEQQPERIYALVGEIVLPHFDFVRMSAWVLGRHWPRATLEQKRRFVPAFRQLLVRTYAVALREYRGQRIEYLPLREDPASGEVTVRSRIVEPGRQPVALYYTLWRHDDRWRVYDISVDGISLVANYRTSFASEIRAHGLDALIARLEQHNRTGETPS